MTTPVDPIIIHPKQEVTLEDEALARQHANRFDGISIAMGSIALLCLAWVVQPILTPFVVMGLLYLLIAPFQEYRSARKIMLTAYALFGLWFFHSLFGLLIPFMLGWVLAYLFNPLVTMLKERYRIHRTWSSLILVALFCGVLVGIGWIFIPSLIVQTQAFIVKLSTFAKQNANSIDEKHLRRIIMSLGIPANFTDQIVTTQAMPWIKSIMGAVPKFIFGLLAGLPKFVERTLNLIIVPIAMFYFLKDWPKIGQLFYDLFPTKNPARRVEIVKNVDRIIYSYVRGQATVAVIVGVLGAIMYYILGIPYAGLLGVILAVSDLIPIVGMIFSMFIVELVIVLTMELTPAVILSGIAVIVGLHFLEVYIIGPKIVGEGVGIPPILMILALLVFGYFMGFMGLLIAVPATAVIILFIDEYRRQQTESEANA